MPEAVDKGGETVNHTKKDIVERSLLRHGWEYRGLNGDDCSCYHKGPHAILIDDRGMFAYLSQVRIAGIAWDYYRHHPERIRFYNGLTVDL